MEEGGEATPKARAAHLRASLGVAPAGLPGLRGMSCPRGSSYVEGKAGCAPACECKCVNTYGYECVSVCASPCCWEEPRARPPGGEVWLWFWHSSHGFCSGLAARVTKGDSIPFQATNAAAPQPHLVQVGWTVASGWGSVSAVSRLRCRLLGTRLREPLRWAMTLPGTTRSACRVPAVSHTELGVPEGKVSGGWPLHTGALSLRQVAPSRVGGWNSAAVNLGETGCTFLFKTKPEATAPSEGCARCWQHLGLSAAEAPTEVPASLCSVQICMKFLFPIQMRLALPLLTVLVRKPTS